MQNIPFSVVRVTVECAELLSILSRRTFTEAFSAVNDEQYMNAYMDVAYASGQLALELSNPDSHFFFACQYDRPAGYLKVNFNQAQSDIRDPDAMEIERIYVLESFQGKGVGQLLMNRAMDMAEAAGVRYIWLGVWEHNVKAQNFYRQNGFEVFGEHPFFLGEDEQTDWLMRRELYRSR